MLVDRLQATRLQLLDVYGHARAAAERPRRAGRWCPSRSRWSPSARTPPTPGRSSSSRARRAARVRAGPVHDALGRRRGRGADLDQRRPGPAGAARPHRPRGRARDRGDLRRASPARCSACAGRSAGPGRSSEIEGADVVVVAGGIGLAPLRPAILRAAGAPRALRPARAALRRAHARPAALRRRARGVGASAGSRSRSPSTAPGRSGAGTSAS